MASATDASHFSVTNSWGEALTIHGVEQLDPTNLLLHTDARIEGLNYILTVAGLRDLATASNRMNRAEAVSISLRQTVIPWDASWRFHDPFPPFDPIHPGAAWHTIDFLDVAQWETGPAGFGFNPLGIPVPVATRTPLPQSAAITSFFRRGFDAEISPWGARAHLRHAVDDGAVFYLNGRELHRFNLPASELSPLTPALADPDPVFVENVPAPATTDWLRRGTNLLAAALHAAEPVDRDRFFAAELEVEFQSYPEGPVLFLTAPMALSIGENHPFVLSATGVGADRFQWLRDGEPIPGATNSVLHAAAAPLSWDGSLIQLHAANDELEALSDGASLNVIADLERPKLVSALYRFEDGIIELVFNEPIDPDDAVDPSSYHVRTKMGQPLVILSATMSAPSVIELHLETAPIRELWLSMDTIRDRAMARNALRTGLQIKPGLRGGILPLDAVWKFEQSGQPPDVSWREAKFDDSDWPSGPGVFASLSEPLPPNVEAGTAIDLRDNLITTYFRHAFDLPETLQATLTFSNLIDDGAVFHLNEMEVARVGMPEGEVTHETLAARTVPNVRDFEGLQIPAATLVSGNNVLAVEVHQDMEFSSDKVFGCVMHIETSSLIVPPPAYLDITRQGTAIILSWEGDGFQLESTERLSGAQTVWDPVAMEGPTIQLPVTNSSRFFRLRPE